MSALINASTSSGLVQTADTSGTLELQSNGTTKFTVSSTGAYGQVVSGTAVASTSGTSIDFTGIPSWVKRITVMFNGVSLSSNSPYAIVQLGAGSVTTSGYLGTLTTLISASSVSTLSTTTGFYFGNFAAAADTVNGQMVLTLQNSNNWVASGTFGNTNSLRGLITAGNLSLGGTLDRVRITTTDGTTTFDAGSINILYEG